MSQISITVCCCQSCSTASTIRGARCSARRDRGRTRTSSGEQPTRIFRPSSKRCVSTGCRHASRPDRSRRADVEAHTAYGRASVAGHRHGSRTRSLTGTFGPIEIAVPRARLTTADGKTTEGKSQTLRAYQRRTLAADALIATTYLAGTNPRRVGGARDGWFAGAGARGLEKGIGCGGGGVPVQRWTVHKHRNLFAHAPERLHDEITADYNDMIYATTPEEIEARRKAFIRKWRLKHRAVADSLEEAGERLFTFTRLPPSQWRSVRTTNAIERLHEEFKRRIKTQTVQPSEDTAAMLFWALLPAE